jgi:hypothetical protein
MEAEVPSLLLLEKNRDFDDSQPPQSYLEREAGLEPATLCSGKLGFLADRLPE